jgi:hypothetical protein
MIIGLILFLHCIFVDGRVVSVVWVNTDLNCWMRRFAFPLLSKQEGLEKLLSKVNPSKSPGPDNIPNRIIKQCAVQLTLYYKKSSKFC